MENQMMPTIDVREMALKCTTKREVYRVLTTTAGVYLPSIDQINCDFVRDILSGDKLIIEDPHVEDLRIPDILQFARKHCEIDLYMPEYECEKYPSRKWICNVGTKQKDKFRKFVNEKLIENNKRNDDLKGSKFSVMAKAFVDTNFVSKGRIERREFGSNNDEPVGLIKQQTKELEDLKEELEEYKERLEDHSKDSEMLKRLYENGYIDLNGNPINGGP